MYRPTRSVAAICSVGAIAGVVVSNASSVSAKVADSRGEAVGHHLSLGGGNATPIPLGASLELTGPTANQGTIYGKAVELAVKAANGKHGFLVGGKRYKWALTLDDNQSTPNLSVAQYQQFVSNGTHFILGPTPSDSFLPAFNSLGTSQAIVFTAAGDIAVTPKPGQSVFQTLSSLNGSSIAYARYVVKTDKPKRVALLLPQDPVGTLLGGIYQKVFQAKGIKVVFNKSFPDTTTDYGPYITTLKAARPDLVVTGYQDQFAQPLMKQAASSGFTSANWMMTIGTTEPEIKTVARPFKHVFMQLPVKSVVDRSDALLTYFRTAWKRTFHTNVVFNDDNGLYYFDPVLMLTEALQKAKTVTNTSKIAEALLRVKIWPDEASTGVFQTRWPGDLNKGGSVIATRDYPVSIGELSDHKVTYGTIPNAS